MLQPGGAMALFAFRLAGLLSLEKALTENNSMQVNVTEMHYGDFEPYVGYNSSNETASYDYLYSGNVTNDSLYGGHNDTYGIVDHRQSEGIENITSDILLRGLEDFHANGTESVLIDTLTNNTYTDNDRPNKTEQTLDKDFEVLFEDISFEKDTNSTYNVSESRNDTFMTAEQGLPHRDTNTGFSDIFISDEKDIQRDLKIPSPRSSLSPAYSSPIYNDTFHGENYLSFEAFPENFVNFSNEYENDANWSHSDNILSSRSLVAHIPNSDGMEEDDINTGIVSAVSDDTQVSKNNNEGKLLKREGISPIHTDVLLPNTSRNNPYPYGPKILPSSQLPYDPNLNADDLSTSFGSSILSANVTYDDYYMNYSDYTDHVKEERRKLLLKSDEPRVLFHFEKPGGYSPKLPDSSQPPTRAPTPSDPSDCVPKCPKYQLVDWNPDYDIRHYPETTWISTVIIAKNRILAELEGYMKVQDYFYGLNDRGQLINLTVPFMTQVKHGIHPGVIKETPDFVISLYINHEDDPYGSDLPTPISNEVLIDRLESKTVFVSGFEANVWEVNEEFLKNKASQLMTKLRQNGEAFLDRYFYLASYSRPELYQPVYYELWVYATTFRETFARGSHLAQRRRSPSSKITTRTVDRLCRGVECPPFEVLRTYRYGIQKRRYYDALFVTTSPGECQFSTISVWKGFMPLHLYKHGINSHMEVLEATRPIAMVHIKEDSTSGTECPQNMTMAIYLPKRLHTNPPLTGFAAPPVVVSALQDVVVYAYTVGGYLLEPDRIRKELSNLRYRLTEFGICFKNDEYYVVVYDFIVRYHGRQNEIWVVAESCKATRNG